MGDSNRLSQRVLNLFERHGDPQIHIDILHCRLVQVLELCCDAVPDDNNIVLPEVSVARS